MILGLQGGGVIFGYQRHRKRESIYLENATETILVLVVARHVGPHLSATELCVRFEIPPFSSVQCFPYTFLELHESFLRADRAVSAHVFFLSDWSRPDLWTTLCPSLFLSCEKLIFGRRDDGHTLAARALKREKHDHLVERLRIPFHIHNTRDLAGEASLFALSTYLEWARPDDYGISHDPFLFRRGIKISVGFDRKRLSLRLDVIRDDRVDEERDNYWEELRFWHAINNSILEIANGFIFASDKATDISDEDVLSAVYSSLLKLHGFDCRRH